MKEAELHALVLRFYFSFLIKDLVKEILGSKLRMEAMIYNKTVFIDGHKDWKTAKNRIQIAILSWQIFDIGELDSTESHGSLDQPTRQNPWKSPYSLKQHRYFKILKQTSFP